MTKILFWAEPHPIRNFFKEFGFVANQMCQIGLHKELKGISWKIFSNQYVLKDLIQGIDKDSVIFPTEFENDTIDGFLENWDEDNINQRTSMINEKGAHFQFYKNVLERIYEFYKFDYVILWSENGSVKSFCRDKDVTTLHLELGPTRPPFRSSIYIDPFGTNANASTQSSKISSIIKDEKKLDLSYWAGESSSINQWSAVEEITCGVIPLEFQEKKYVIIAMQLADDLNTILHSDFDSPLSYLQSIIPTLINKNFNVLLKRHPGAIHREYNIIKEEEAIIYAEMFSENVKVLDDKISGNEFLSLIGKANAVLSINSSVSYESWLVGVPGLISGRSVYDIDNKIKLYSDDFLKGKNPDPLVKEEIEKNISFLQRYYFFEFSIENVAERICKLVENASCFGDEVKYLKKNQELFDCVKFKKMRFN